MNYYWTKLDTPKGIVYLFASDKALIWVSTPGSSYVKGEGYVRKKFRVDKLINEENIILKTAKKELEKYFSGEHIHFSGPFELNGTEFQKKVWHEMQNIPYGMTVPYSTVARSIGSPKAVRAVGMTCGLNPIAIMIPCHRVVGKSGKLTGYAGGLEIKKWLVELERNKS